MNYAYINLNTNSIPLLVKVNTEMLKQIANKEIKKNQQVQDSQVEHDQTSRFIRLYQK